MNYPLISEYIEAIKSAEDNFEELNYLRPVLGDDGLPVMTSGNFAVVFKMSFVALSCFHPIFGKGAFCRYRSDNGDRVPCTTDGLGGRQNSRQISAGES